MSPRLRRSLRLLCGRAWRHRRGCGQQRVRPCRLALVIGVGAIVSVFLGIATGIRIIILGRVYIHGVCSARRGAVACEKLLYWQVCFSLELRKLRSCGLRLILPAGGSFS